MCNLPGSGVEPVFTALAGEFLTTGPRGKSCIILQYMNDPVSLHPHQHLVSSPLYFSCSDVYVQFSSVQSLSHVWLFVTPLITATPGLPVHHKLPEFTQTHAHRVGDAIQPSHPLSSPSPPALNPSQHQGLSQWVSSSHEVAEVLEFQLQHQSFQWTPRTDLL